jgi:hypothetical protein
VSRGSRNEYRLVEPLIYYTPAQKFQVRLRLNTVYKQATFSTIGEARKWKEEALAMRPKRDKNRGKPDLSAHKTEQRATVKEILAKAPRTQVVIDDVEYTVVRLPDAPIVRDKGYEPFQRLIA